MAGIVTARSGYAGLVRAFSVQVTLGELPGG